ncbi:helix-turn-helix domain-containing protein [Chloroflexota bacterium]
MSRDTTDSQLGLYTNQFTEVFSELLGKHRVTCYQICRVTGIDQAYLSRLRSGERGNPSVEVVMRISLALMRCSENINIHDIERLFRSVGRSIGV